MKTLITGGCGFIGSHLADLLVDLDYEVVVIDNLSVGRKENISHLLEKSKFTFIKADIVDFDSIENVFKGVDWVFHLAALADIVPSIENPKQYYQSNVNGTFNVLEACRKYHVKKIIYSASSSCYGIPDEYPTKEISEIRPQYPYALTKNLGEILSNNLGFWMHTSDYETKRVDLIENTPEEIRDVAVEMVERLNNTWQEYPEDEALQHRFWELFTTDVGDAYIGKPLHGEIRARFGAAFLRNNPDWLQ